MPESADNRSGRFFLVFGADRRVEDGVLRRASARRSRRRARRPRRRASRPWPWISFAVGRQVARVREPEAAAVRAASPASGCRRGRASARRSVSARLLPSSAAANSSAAPDVPVVTSSVTGRSIAPSPGLRGDRLLDRGRRRPSGRRLVGRLRLRIAAGDHARACRSSRRARAASRPVSNGPSAVRRMSMMRLLRAALRQRRRPACAPSPPRRRRTTAIRM